MSAANHTQFLSLPIWDDGVNKPTFLGDMNDAFTKIDKGVSTASANADSSSTTANLANDKADINTGEITSLKGDVNLLKTNQTALNKHLTDVDADIATNSNDIASNKADISVIEDKVPFSFGVDTEGNYGYIKEGATDIIPFEEGKGVTTASVSFLGAYNAGKAENQLGLKLPMQKWNTCSVHVNAGTYSYTVNGSESGETTMEQNQQNADISMIVGDITIVGNGFANDSFATATFTFN